MVKGRGRTARTQCDPNYDYAGEEEFHMDMTGDPKRRVIDEMTN